MKRMIIASEDKFEYVMSPGLKPWSEAEAKRTAEVSNMIGRLYKEDLIDDVYEETFLETVYSEPLTTYQGEKEEYTIDKQCLSYLGRYDENDNRVKPGGKVPGSIYYSVSNYGDLISETDLGYKTVADAKHAIELDRDWNHQKLDWYSARRRK